MGELTTEQGMVYILRNASGVSAIVAARIYPWDRVPQNAPLEYITYFRVASNHIHDMSGPSGLVNPHMQVDCWAEKYSEAKALAKQTRLALDGYTGSVTISTDSVTFRQIHMDDESDMFIPAGAGAETGPARVSQDYTIWHTIAAS